MGNSDKLPALILAGAPADPELKEKYSVDSRAMAPVAGKPMVQHVVDALRVSSHVGDICVLGNIRCDGVAKAVPPAGNMLDNLIEGMKACSCGADGPVLVSTSDIPMLTPEAVEDFVRRCGDLDADFYYPVIPREANEKRFPGVRRTYVRLAEGTFTGGNIVVMNSRFITENADLIREVLSARKSPIRLAKIIGLGVLIRVLIAQVVWQGAINIAALERTVGRILNARVKAIQTPYPEIGADVDDIEQLEAVERLIRGNG